MTKPCPVCFQVTLTLDEIRELVLLRLVSQPDEAEWVARLVFDALNGKEINLEAL